MIVTFIRLFVKFAQMYDDEAPEDELAYILSYFPNEYMPVFYEAFKQQFGHYFAFYHDLYQLMLEGGAEVLRDAAKEWRFDATSFAYLAWNSDDAMAAFRERASILQQAGALPRRLEYLLAGYPYMCGVEVARSFVRCISANEAFEPLSCTNFDEIVVRITALADFADANGIFTILTDNLDGDDLFIAELVWGRRLGTFHGVARAIAIAFYTNNPTLLRLAILCYHGAPGVLGMLWNIDPALQDPDVWIPQLEYLFR